MSQLTEEVGQALNSTKTAYCLFVFVLFCCFCFVFCLFVLFVVVFVLFLFVFLAQAENNGKHF